MTEYVNITNMYELANAIKERNAIEKNRLNFEKEVFEFNKQLNVSSIKSNEDMVEVMKSLMDKFDTIDKAIQTLSANDSYLKKQIDELDFSVRNLQ
jgi:chaperonin cofactor prefoldin